MRCLAEIEGRKLARRVCFSAVCLLGLCAISTAEEPLHVRIDQLVQAAQTGPSADECTDAEFLRRVSLDLNGMIPTATEARAYLEEASPEKRIALIDRLLNHPRYARHLAVTLDVMLMERRRNTHVKDPEWQKYLHDSMVANKPFDQLAREILAADGADEKMRPAARFYLDREGEPHGLTRDVGRIFFGRDMQCAQCHDHPLIDDYLQDDYYGIFAFLNRTSLFTDLKAKKSFLAEKADGDAVFSSVFTLEKGQTLPRLPGETEIDEPVIPAAQAYKVKPAKKVRSVPTYSRRVALSKQATSGANRAFNRNIANRLWAHMMGRGLVHPLDLHHPGNPPSHPELLDLLADEIVAMKYDIKAFLRELALTQTYRRSFNMPTELSGMSEVVSTKLAPLNAEHERWQTTVAKLEAETDTAHDKMLAAVEAVFQAETAYQNAAKAHAAVNKVHNAAAKALAGSQKSLATKEQAAKALADAQVKADEVVKQFPKDEALIAAAKTYGERSKKTADEIAALKKTIETHTAAAKAAQEKTVEPQKLLQAAAKKLAETRQQLSDAREPYFKKLYAYRAARTQAVHFERRINHVNAMAAYTKASQEHQAAAEAVALAQTGLSKLQTAGLQAEAEFNAANEQLTIPQQAHTDIARKAETLRKKFHAEQTLAQQVQAAAQAGQAALVALPQDADLQSSTQQLLALAAQLQTELKNRCNKNFRPLMPT